MASFRKPWSPKDAQIRRLASSIPDQTTLDRVLDSAKPWMREAVFERIRPHLKFPNPVLNPKEAASARDAQGRTEAHEEGRHAGETTAVV